MYGAWALLLSAPDWRWTVPLSAATAMGLSTLYSLLSANFGLLGNSYHGFRNVFTYEGVSRTLQQQEVGRAGVAGSLPFHCKSSAGSATPGRLGCRWCSTLGAT
jgi:hypothetical protein